MTKRMKAEAWTLGYEWAMGNIYIGIHSFQYAHLQKLPEYEEGIEEAMNALKKQLLIELVLGEPDEI